MPPDKSASERPSLSEASTALEAGLNPAKPTTPLNAAGAPDASVLVKPSQSPDATPIDQDSTQSMPRAGAAAGPLQGSIAGNRVLADRYKIIRFVGRGAMGEVYEADDITLQQRIAVKLIAPEISCDQRALARFRREIQMARLVTHPSVCRIFDIGSHQEEDQPNTGQLTFFTMEFLDGQTLSQYLRPARLLSPSEALSIVEQVAAGLDAAHRAGVIHRDLKCSNIMLVPTSGAPRAVITDFGLARLSETFLLATGSISTPDELIGTPDYMAPEQVRGEPATTLSDIYSLGVVMFFMVTGKLPFHGKNARATALKRLETDAPSPRFYVPDLDANWESTIGRCLARDPKDRFWSATDVVKALHGKLDEPRKAEAKPDNFLRLRKYWKAFSLALLLFAIIAAIFVYPRVHQRIHGAAAAPSVPDQKQLAVLPFIALNGDKESTAFAKGLAETLASRLTRLTENHSLQLISMRELAGNNIETIPKARQEFGINLGLEGSVEQSGATVRVTYHLVDAKTMRQLRGDTITASASDPFALEDSVADSVARALELELQPGERTILTSDRRTEPSAYDFYLQGRGYLQDFIKPVSLDSAITVFKSALALDSKYAPAHAGLGEAYWYRYEATRDPKWVKDATEECNRAVEYDDADAQGHTCLGTIYEGSGEYERAAQQFERALKLEPTSDDAVRGLASAYDTLKESAKAEETYRQAIALRPQYWRNYNMLGVFYYTRSKYDEAARMFHEVTALAPDNYRGYNNLGGIFLLQGRYAEAVPLFERAVVIQPNADAYSNLGTTYFYLRNFPESARVFAEAVKRDDQNFVMWGHLANTQARIPGMQSEAAHAYRRAIGLAERELQVNPRNTRVLADLADYYSMTGDNSKALEYIRRALALGSGEAWVMFKAAEVYEQLGQSDTAVTWLVKALDAGYSPTMARDTPTFDGLRSDPRVRARLVLQK